LNGNTTVPAGPLAGRQLHTTPDQMPIDTSAASSVLDVRVYYEDTDAGGVVFYANYLKFLERGRTEWLRALGVNQSELAMRERRLFVVKGLEIEYFKPARLDDLLRVYSRITHVGRAYVDFHQVAQVDGQDICASTIRVCCIDADTHRPTGLPPTIRTLLLNAQE